MQIRYLLPVLLLPLLATGCKKDADKDKENAAQAIPTIAVAEPEVMTVTLTQTFPGTLTADRKIDIVARVDGVLHSHINPGDRVKKGQLLYSIDDSKYRDAVRQAEATLATSQANYEYYKKQYAAMEKAYKADAVSEMELLQAKNNMEQSLASINDSRAALDEARTMMGYCRITAPFDGTVAMHVYDKDSYINGEASPVKLNTLYNDDVVYANISIDEARYQQIVSDQQTEGLRLDSVKINFSSPLLHEYFSKINYQAPSVSTSTGTIALNFKLYNPYGELKEGMYMNVKLPYAIARDAILVKDASISTDQLGKYVYLVNDSNKVVYTPIEVGELYNDSLRIVTKGLTPKSRYVTEALLKVRDGMKVNPKL